MCPKTALILVVFLRRSHATLESSLIYPFSFALAPLWNQNVSHSVIIRGSESHIWSGHEVQQTAVLVQTLFDIVNRNEKHCQNNGDVLPLLVL